MEYEFRPWLVRWLYGYALLHFLVGIGMTWMMESTFFESYHQLVLGRFWPEGSSVIARELHLWWLKLFGATLQFAAIFMAVLIYMGDRTRRAAVWLWMMIGLMVWGPQDIYVSLQRDLWMHLWMDLFVLSTMLPPLFLLWQFDRREM